MTNSNKILKKVLSYVLMMIDMILIFIYFSSTSMLIKIISFVGGFGMLGLFWNNKLINDKIIKVK